MILLGSSLVVKNLRQSSSPPSGILKRTADYATNHRAGPVPGAMSQEPNGTSRAEGQSARGIDTTDAHEPHRRWPRDYLRRAAKTAAVTATATTMSIRNDIGNRANHDFDRKPRSIETVSCRDEEIGSVGCEAWLGLS